MRKTSVYLPEALKEQLGALARRSGNSESELIRTAIEHLVRSDPPQLATHPEPPPRPGPRLVGIGVGPGNPDLLTTRAPDELRHADRVMATAAGHDVTSRAEMVVMAALPNVSVDRLPIAIGNDAASRRHGLEEAADGLIVALDRLEVVAVVTLGDPNVFSIFSTLARCVHRRRPHVVIETVPGVMAFQELAARSGTVLSDQDDREGAPESLRIVTAPDDLACLEGDLADPSCTVVVYRGGRHLPEIADRLAAHGRLDGAVVGELLGLPGERSQPVAARASRPASYLATIIVPATRNEDP